MNGAGSKPSGIDILKVLTIFFFFFFFLCLRQCFYLLSISYILLKYLIIFLFVLLSFHQLLE